MKDYFDLYTDCLISNNGLATATGFSAMTDGEVGYDQIIRFLSKGDFTSKTLWREVKATVRLNVVAYETICCLLLKSLKSNAALGKSPTKTIRTQINHIFLSIMAVFKLECLKIKHHLNHFALKAKLLIRANQIAFAELQRLKGE